MKILSADEVHQISVESLGLDGRILDLTTVEALAACLRRAAGSLCPCSGRTLVHVVMMPLRDLVDDLNALEQLCGEILESIVSHGDLLELNVSEPEEDSSTARTLLHLAPPSFVRRESTAIILLGIAPDDVSPLPKHIQPRVEYANHVRMLAAGDNGVADELREFGYVELSLDTWTRAPRHKTACRYVEEFNNYLECTPRSGELPGLLILDPQRPVRYYRGRWTDPVKRTGRFVARRAQAYGADLWCYVELDCGSPTRFVDLPPQPGVWRGCDIGWYLQLAIDHELNFPQLFRPRAGPADTIIIDLFSPVPMWARRRWDAIGEPVSCQGCLLSYRFRSTEVEEELNFAREGLWLAEFGS